ncbi:hypothetical protein U1Q18_042772 [Sarracenia purpurea var. burkii]
MAAGDAGGNDATGGYRRQYRVKDKDFIGMKRQSKDNWCCWWRFGPSVVAGSSGDVVVGVHERRWWLCHERKKEMP